MSVSLLDLYRTLGSADAKNIRRDPLLVWVGILPFVLAMFLRALVSWLERAGYAIGPYEPLIASAFVTAAPGVVGMVAGFLLLDERDEGVLAAIAVTPVRPLTWIAYRVTLPLLAAIVMTILAYPVMGFAPLPWTDLVAVAAVASLLAPATALFLAAFAENKVAGFAMVKILNTINIAPVAAWFIDPPWQWLIGIVPAYWPMKMAWLAHANEAYAIHAAAGIAVGAAWIALLRRKPIVSAA